MVLEELDVGMRLHALQQRPLDLAPRHVGGVHDAVGRVAALAPEVERAVGGAVEVGAERDELAHAAGSLADHHLHHVRVAEAGAGHERVGDVVGRVVVRVHHGRDAALGVVGVGLGALFLRHDGDGAGIGDAEGERETGDAGADDEKVVRAVHESGAGRREQVGRKRFPTLPREAGLPMRCAGTDLLSAVREIEWRAKMNKSASVWLEAIPFYLAFFIRSVVLLGCSHVTRYVLNPANMLQMNRPRTT